MILGIDVGNSNIVYGPIYTDDELQNPAAETSNGSTQLLRIKTELSSIEIIGKYFRDHDFEAAICSCVVPHIAKALKQEMPELIFVSPDMKMDMKICIDDPYELGQDLIVAAIAAIDEYPLPHAVIDMGTATTIFIVDKDKNFVGGTIHPGIKIELRSLGSDTALLPNLTFKAPEKVIGTNSIDCIQSGILYGHAGMIDSIISRAEAELGCTLNCIATGGLTQFVAPLTQHKITVDDNLIMKGLKILYKQNK